MLILVFKGPFLGSDRQSPAADRGGLSSIPGHSMWHSWWTKWHCGRVFSRYFGFLLSVSFHQFSIFFHVATALLGQGLLDRTPVPQWSANRRHLYLPTYKRQTFMPLPGFEPAIPENERPQTLALDSFAPLSYLSMFCLYQDDKRRSLRTIALSSAISRIRDRWQKVILTSFFIIKVLITLLLSKISLTLPLSWHKLFRYWQAAEHVTLVEGCLLCVVRRTLHQLVVFFGVYTPWSG